ncbi:hypothetical protein [Gorillibacterium massiliense]|uniref:hypothetical protein n=1 Tax=Gorillibacterium massiliense TaxID=1280390 RepID=UPI0005928B74|nr:hypothetical protein [Gorillibacterium massiliense]
MKRKLLLCLSIILVLSCISIPAFAQTNATPSMSPTEYQTELKIIGTLLDQDKTPEEGTLSYMENAIGQNDMMKII